MNNYLTEEAINILKKEIEERKVITRKEINDDLKEAKSHGDSNGNFEYNAVKREKAKNESRIKFLERMVKTAILIKDDSKFDEVGLNKEVIIKFINDDFCDKFLIVTTIEADPLNNKISIESPLGKALFKHRIGEKVLVQSPDENYIVEILNVKKLSK